MGGPFQVGGAVEPPYFVGRGREIAEITEGLRSLSQNYLIIAPRRTGKTSLLLAIRNELADKEVLPTYLNCRGMTTLEGFARGLVESTLGAYEVKYKRGLLETFTKSVKGKILDALRRVERVGGSVRKIGEIYITFREEEIDDKKLLSGAFGFLEEFAAEKGLSVIVLLDELQKTCVFDGCVFELFKDKIDVQKNVRYCVSGSSVSMLNDIFLRGDSPLYMMFTKVYLPPLPEEITQRFVKERLEAFNVRITQPALRLLYAYTGGIPYYVQKLGHFCFVESPTHRIDKEAVITSFGRMLTEFDEEFESRFMDRFSPKRQAILRTIARREGAKVSDVAEALGIPVNYLGESMRFLVESMVLQRVSRGYYDFYDPVFKAWLRERL